MDKELKEKKMGNEITKFGESIKITKETIKQYICPIATDQELTLFFELCKSRNLNPFIKEAYLIKYGDQPAGMVVAKDVFLKRANKQPDYKGFKAGLILKKKDTAEIIRTDGFYDKSTDEIVGGWCTVFREGKESTTVEVALNEYMGLTRDGRPNKTWATKEGTMIRKVSIVQAHREAYPDEFQGMYDESELDSIQKNNGVIDFSQDLSEYKEKIDALTLENFLNEVKNIGQEASCKIDKSSLDELRAYAAARLDKLKLKENADEQ